MTIIILENQLGGLTRKKKKGYIRRHRFGVGGPQGIKEKEKLERRLLGRRNRRGS
jgi:hypothetical protein